MIQPNERKAYKEVVTIINNMDENYKNRIPPKLFSFLEANSETNHQFGINGSVALKDQNIMDETKSLLALFTLKYWCESEEQKQQLLRIYTENERKYLKEQEEKFPADIFGTNKNNTVTETIEENNTAYEENAQANAQEETENTDIVEYNEEKWYQKIFRKIINLFKAKSPAR